MKELTVEQLEENWNKLIQIIKDTFEEESERRENLLRMYHYFEERMVVAPASGKPSINKVMKRLDEFISDGFTEKGNHSIKEYRKNPSTKNCKWCEFKDKPELCDRKVA